MKLFVAAPPVPDAVWTAAMRWLGPAMARSPDADEAKVRRMLDEALAQLWTAWDGQSCRAALVTTRHDDTLHMWLCGGRGADWGGLLTRIMRFSRPHGVTGWTVDGRKGWQRVLKEVAHGRR